MWGRKWWRNRRWSRWTCYSHHHTRSCTRRDRPSWSTQNTDSAYTCPAWHRPHYSNTVGPQTHHTRSYTRLPHHTRRPPLSAASGMSHSGPPRSPRPCNCPTRPRPEPPGEGCTRRPGWRHRSQARPTRKGWTRLGWRAERHQIRNIEPSQSHSRLWRRRSSRLGQWSRGSGPIPCLTRSREWTGSRWNRRGERSRWRRQGEGWCRR